MENYLGFGLADSGRVESHPIFLVIIVKLSDGFLLIQVKIQLLHGNLNINALAGNAGR